MSQNAVDSDVSIEYEYPSFVPLICHNSLPFQWFNIELMHPLLQSCKPFIVAIQKVEGVIRNDNLVLYFVQMCLSQFRIINVLSATQVSPYINDVRAVLIRLLPQLRFSVRRLASDFSIFIRMSNKSAEYDEIIYDETMIRGMTYVTKKDDSSRPAFARSVLLLFAKTMHEIAHAYVAETGRFLGTPDFDTPATHKLSSEAGDAIERFMFGSVLDVVGKYSGDRSMYHISRVVFREGRKPASVSSITLKRFLQTDMSVIETLHDIISRIRKKRTKTRKRTMTYMTRKSKKPYQQKKSRNISSTDVTITTTIHYKNSRRENSISFEDDFESDEPHLAPDKYGFLCAYGPILGIK